MRPSRARPVTYFFHPPHCLKKYGTPAFTHRSRIAVTHSRRTGWAFGPDSPPTITQSMPSRRRDEIGPKRGSQERNLTLAPHPRRWSARNMFSSSSLVTPIQILGVQGNSEGPGRGQVLLCRISSSLRSRPDAVFALCLWNLRPTSLSLGFHEIQALQEKLSNPENLHFPLHLLEILISGD